MSGGVCHHSPAAQANLVFDLLRHLIYLRPGRAHKRSTVARAARPNGRLVEWLHHEVHGAQLSRVDNEAARHARVAELVVLARAELDPLLANRDNGDARDRVGLDL